MNLEELCAREQIREVLYSYCRGLDRGDVKLIEGVYHPDATDYHGTFKGLGREFASHIVASMDPVAAPAQHHLTNILIRFDQPGGKAASVETYFIAFHPQSVAEDDSTKLAFVGGRYLDRFEHRDGAWRISERRAATLFVR